MRPALWMILALLPAWATGGSAIISFDPQRKPEAFAAQEVASALADKGFTTSFRLPRNREPGRWHIEFVSAKDGAQAQDIETEGFVLRRESPERHIVVLSRDTAGALYGGLELAEQIRASGIESVTETRRNPHFAMRGTKFNLPLDLRSPSYSDMSDSAQANIATVWDFGFWRAYLDQLARDRYNFVSLWNLHPFPSMVRVPEYPDVALRDVWRTKAPLGEDYSTRTTDLLTPAMLADKQVVKRLTMAQKIAFWRRVMEYARDRNIQFYVVTWNIFTYGVQGKNGITDALDNPRTIDYFRASVREMFRTYPLLAGIGVTAGENMGEISGPDAFQAKENWIQATYGEGMRDAMRLEPQRRFRFIHRQHESRAQDIAATFKDLIGEERADFVFSFKYAQAHVLSSTTQTFHRGYLESLGELETLWTLRNDDALLYRWAAPDFVREFVRNIPRDKTRGYYFGSDMWVWGREFLALDPKLKGQLETDKHWLHFLLWGRMAYDPTLDNERIAALVARRFPGIDAKLFLSLWQDASMVYPLVTGFHWADFDFQWYIEGCRSRPGPARTASGFHSVETFIHQAVHPGTDNLSIPRYVAGVVAGSIPAGTTPMQVAEQLDALADRVLGSLTQVPATRGAQDAEFAATVGDLKSMALLGKYYAAKIRGATELALFRATRVAAHQSAAVRHLEMAYQAWQRYTANSSSQYRNPLWTNRVGYVDWRELGEEARKDIAIAAAPLP